MPLQRIYTLYDLIEHLSTVKGGAPLDNNQRDVRTAAMTAINDLAEGFDWKAYMSPGRIYLNAAQTSSTITFDLTGGTYERMVTIAAGTWPSWAASGTLIIANVRYKVDQRKTSTIITLTEDSCPTADVAAGTSYTIYQSIYALPGDFRKLIDLSPQQNSWGMSYVKPEDWLRQEQWNQASSATPHLWTIFGSPDSYGLMALHLHPYPSAATTIDFIYQRSPRQAFYSGLSANDRVGTVAVSGTTVTGTSTAFASRMVGSVIRFGDSSNVPQGAGGIYPFVDQRTISTYSSATSIGLDATPAVTIGAGTKYLVTDPLDIQGYMWPALVRCAEYHLTQMTKPDKAANAYAAYLTAVRQAKERDMVYDPSPYLEGGPVYRDLWAGAVADA